jgi:small subunit ribosomal protein S9
MATATTHKPLTGRRKEAVARVRLVAGSGNITVNGRPIAEYLMRDSLVLIAKQPLALTNNLDKFDVIARVMGGGLTGQAGAIRMGVARALLKQDEALRGLLGREGLLTRDSRMKERKKYGQPGARKRFQFSKR